MDETRPKNFLVTRSPEKSVQRPLEHFAMGKLSVTHWNKLVSLAQIVHVVNGIAAALKERRTDYLTIDRYTKLGLEGFAQRLILKRIMPSQGGVTTGDDSEVSPCLPRSLGDAMRNLTMDLSGMLRREAPRIREDKEQVVTGREGTLERLWLPITVDAHVMGTNAPTL